MEVQSNLTIGQKIRKARREKDLTQEELAKLLGITKATVNRYESGVVSNIPRSKIIALSTILDLPITDFFTFNNEGTGNIQGLLDTLDQRLPAEEYVGVKGTKGYEIIPAKFVKSPTAFPDDAQIIEISDEEKELLRIYKKLSVRKRMQLLNQAYALEDEEAR